MEIVYQSRDSEADQEASRRSTENQRGSTRRQDAQEGGYNALHECKADGPRRPKLSGVQYRGLVDQMNTGPGNEAP